MHSATIQPIAKKFIMQNAETVDKKYLTNRNRYIIIIFALHSAQ